MSIESDSPVQSGFRNSSLADLLAAQDLKPGIVEEPETRASCPESGQDLLAQQDAPIQ